MGNFHKSLQPMLLMWERYGVLGDVFIEKGSHSLCGSQAGLELMEILDAGITGVSHLTQFRVSLLTCLLFLFGFL